MDNFKSFHNGGVFFLSNLLVHSLASIFMNDNISRIKIARFLSSKKYQNLLVKLGISTMKTIASFVSFRQSIVPSNNKGLKKIYKNFDDPEDATIFIARFIHLFQLLIGIKCPEKTLDEEFSLNEFFSFEFAREFGLFDDFSSNDYNDENIIAEQKQMLYLFVIGTCFVSNFFPIIFLN